MPSTMKDAVSVVIPAKNEKNNVPIMISLLMERYGSYIKEILVIDDGSTDGTGNEVISLGRKFNKVHLIQRSAPSGVGLAIREGILNISDGIKYVLLMDCDFIMNIPDIAKLFSAIDNYDGIVGSRFMVKNSLRNYPLVKYIANRSYHFLARILLRIPHSDLSNNLKLYKKELMDKIYPFLTSRDFAINAELGFYPVILGAKIGQVPVMWQEREGDMGKSKFKIFKVGPSYMKVFLNMLIFRRNRKQFCDKRRVYQH